MLPRVALLLVFPFIAAASPFFSMNTQTTCPSPSTVGAYAGITCDTGNEENWLQFSGFINSPSATDFEQQALANAADEGFYYNESPGLLGPLTFQIGYSVQAFNETIDSVTFHVTTSSPPQGTADVTLYVCTGPASTCLASPLESLTLGTDTPPSETLTFARTTNISFLFVGNIDSLSTLNQFESSVGTVTDEPGTPLLMGLGLVFISVFYLRRRRAAGAR